MSRAQLSLALSLLCSWAQRIMTAWQCQWVNYHQLLPVPISLYPPFIHRTTSSSTCWYCHPSTTAIQMFLCSVVVSLCKLKTSATTRFVNHSLTRRLNHDSILSETDFMYSVCLLVHLGGSLSTHKPVWRTCQNGPCVASHPLKLLNVYFKKNAAQAIWDEESSFILLDLGLLLPDWLRMPGYKKWCCLVVNG